MQKTPYEKHEATGHKVSRYSPNAVDIIEECQECPARFLHNPAIGYPVTLVPKAQACSPTCEIEKIDRFVSAVRRFFGDDAIGYGSTEQAAIADLQEQLNDE